MFKPITRNEMFKSSAFADNLIAMFQQSYTLDIDLSVKQEAEMLKKYYDHLKPFQPIDQPISSNCVLAYDAKSKQEYVATFPLVLQKFLTASNIQEMYLTYFNNKNLYQFEFENFRK